MTQVAALFDLMTDKSTGKHGNDHFCLKAVSRGSWFMTAYFDSWTMGNGCLFWFMTVYLDPWPFTLIHDRLVWSMTHGPWAMVVLFDPWPSISPICVLFDRTVSFRSRYRTLWESSTFIALDRLLSTWVGLSGGTTEIGQTVWVCGKLSWVNYNLKMIYTGLI